MLIGEPPRTPYDLSFSLFGVPVRVHPFFWVLPVVMGLNSRDVRSLLLIVAAWFLAILLHEIGHAVAMRLYGYHPWITLYGLGGLTSYNPGLSYRGGGASTWRQVLISAAGPGAGFLVAAWVILAILISGRNVQVDVGLRYGILVIPGNLGAESLRFFVFVLLQMCIYWGILNLLPVYPLDGGQISRELFVRFNPWTGMRQSLVLSLATAVALAVAGLLLWQNLFVALLFGYLAYSSYVMLSGPFGGGPWR